MYSFSYLEPVYCSVSSSSCCFLTCIQVSQEAGQVVWYSHLFKNFPQSFVIDKVKGFGIVSKAKEDVFWDSLAFLMIQRMLASWSLVPLPFLNPSWTSGSSWFTCSWSLAWRFLSMTLPECEVSATVWQKGTTEDKTVGWHHPLNGPEFEQAPGDREGQGGLWCCSPWGCKESDMTEQLDNHHQHHLANSDTLA